MTVRSTIADENAYSLVMHIESTERAADRQRHLLRNIRLLPLIRCLAAALIGQSVIVIFWEKEVGVGVQSLFALQMLQSVLVVVLEAPSGFLSDHIGRIRIMRVSAFANAGAFIAYALATDVKALAVAEVLRSLGTSFWSGTDIALLYESLYELGRESEAHARESQNLFLTQTTEALAGILGSYIALFASLRLAMWLTAIPFILIIILVSFFLVEPVEETIDSQERTAAAGFSGLKKVILEIKSDLSPRKDLLLPFGVCCLIFTGTYTASWLHQMLWLDAHIEPQWFGWCAATLNISVSFGALISPKVEAYLGMPSLLATLGLGVCTAFIGMGAISRPAFLIVLAGCVMSLVHGVTTPLIATYCNNRVQSDRRAMIMSVLSLGTRMLFSVISLCIGWIGEYFGLQYACILAGWLLGGSAFLIMRFVPASKKLEAFSPRRPRTSIELVEPKALTL